MDMHRIWECERRQLEKWYHFRLPGSFVQLGWLVFGLTIVGLLAIKLLGGEWHLMRDFLRKGMLVGLLLVSLARDREEDEMTLHLRAQSYAVAFICGVLYAVVQPYITYVLSLWLERPDPARYLEWGGFQVLVFMLLVQVLYYGMLKRTR